MGGKARKHKNRKPEGDLNSCGGEEKRILVQTLSGTLQTDTGIPCEEEENGYSRIEFHMVDLKNGVVKSNYLPYLLQVRTVTSMVALRHHVYLFGRVESDDVDQSQTFFMGSSRLSLNLDKSQSHVWSPAPRPLTKRIFPSCTTLSGRIYSFGPPLNLNPEVLDPDLGRWQPLGPLLPDLVGCSVSGFAIPDSSNNRILVLLSGGQLSSPSLYAFKPQQDHPCGGTWTCIARDFHDWTNVAAVVDDVIYFHWYKFPSNIRAFDIATRTWLKVCWSSSFEKNLHMNYTIIDFKALLPLGNEILCFGGWSHAYDSNDNYLGAVEVTFAKFKVKRMPNHLGTVYVIA